MRAINKVARASTDRIKSGGENEGVISNRRTQEARERH